MLSFRPFADLGHILRDILFPPCCAACRTWIPSSARDYLCLDCLLSIRHIESPICTVCGQPFHGPQGSDHVCGQCMENLPPFDTARSIFQYQGPVRTLIHRLKYNDNGYALKAVSSLTRDYIPQEYINPDMIVPIPLHFRRTRKRGFNQSLRLARAIFPQIPIAIDLLKRTLNTKPQTDLPRKERLRNMRNAFTVSGRVPEGVKTILLLDDIFTTGATAAACAVALKKAGIKEVHVITMARTVLQ